MDSMTYTIDGKDFSDFEGFIKEVNVKLINNEKAWHGNPDAFNDMLRGGFGITPPYTIRWLNSRKSQKDLGHREMENWLTLHRNGVHPTNFDTWNKRIEIAKHNRGETLFSFFVEIIIGHDDVSLSLE